MAASERPNNKAGYLKRSGVFGFKKRYAVLWGNVLSLYSSEKSHKPVLAIDLERSICDNGNSDTQFTIETKKEDHLFQCDTQAECSSWIRTLRTAGGCSAPVIVNKQTSGVNKVMQDNMKAEMERRAAEEARKQDEAKEAIKSLEGMELDEVRAIWERYDTDDSGVLDEYEANNFFRAYAIAKNLDPDHAIKLLWEHFDKNKDGEIEFTEIMNCSLDQLMAMGGVKDPNRLRNYSIPGQLTMLIRYVNRTLESDKCVQKVADLRDGLIVLELVETVSGTKGPTLKEDCANGAEKVENWKLLHEWLPDLGIEVNSWEPEEIVQSIEHALVHMLYSIMVFAGGNTGEFNFKIRPRDRDMVLEAPKAYDWNNPEKRELDEESYMKNLDPKVREDIERMKKEEAARKEAERMSAEEEAKLDVLEGMLVPWVNGILIEKRSPITVYNVLEDLDDGRALALLMMALTNSSFLVSNAFTWQPTMPIEKSGNLEVVRKSLSQVCGIEVDMNCVREKKRKEILMMLGQIMRKYK